MDGDQEKIIYKHLAWQPPKALLQWLLAELWVTENKVHDKLCIPLAVGIERDTKRPIKWLSTNRPKAPLRECFTPALPIVVVNDVSALPLSTLVKWQQATALNLDLQVILRFKRRKTTTKERSITENVFQGMVARHPGQRRSNSGQIRDTQICGAN